MKLGKGMLKNDMILQVIHSKKFPNLKYGSNLVIINTKDPEK